MLAAIDLKKCANCFDDLIERFVVSKRGPTIYVKKAAPNQRGYCLECANEKSDEYVAKIKFKRKPDKSGNPVKCEKCKHPYPYPYFLVVKRKGFHFIQKGSGSYGYCEICANEILAQKRVREKKMCKECGHPL